MDIMQNVPTTYVFTWKKRRYSLTEYLLISTLFLFPFAGIFWLVYWDFLKLADFNKIISSPAIPLFPLIACVVVVAANFVVLQFNRSAKLYIDDSGVRLKFLPDSGLAILNFLEREIFWADLKDATYMTRFKVIQLRSRYAARPLSIRVKDWQLQNTNSDTTARDGEPDLMKVFRGFGIFNKFPKNSQLEAADFDLMKHSATRKLLLAMGCLVVYSSLDVMLQHEGYAFFKPGPHEVASLSAAVILAGLLFRARVRDYIPPGIVVALAIIGGVTFGVASYVAGIRINQLVGGPLLEARYHRDASCQKLLPEDKSLPVVEYTHMTKDYWCSKNIDEVLTVKVRKGLFGLYQFDLREQTEAIRDYKQKV